MGVNLEEKASFSSLISYITQYLFLWGVGILGESWFFVGIMVR